MEWFDGKQHHRKELTSDFFVFDSVPLAEQNDKSVSDRYLTIEGDWNFHWVRNANERPLDFYKLDLDDSSWGSMPM